eukprot:TRINITY_DN2_c0_g1_i6.p1 TRINITY_DN2_c0_g1~~TRINITY_DN2_c0_g1_i6.p1  ORF type:complete len:124 (+),score=9.29 TRINITY_DN2_c0_g1_i6:274-645(+)
MATETHGGNQSRWERVSKKESSSKEDGCERMDTRRILAPHKSEAGQGRTDSWTAGTCTDLCGTGTVFIKILYSNSGDGRPLKEPPKDHTWGETRTIAMMPTATQRLNRKSERRKNGESDSLLM